MVNEQKAKAYDEALERARKQRDEYQKELDKTDKNSQLANILRAGISAIELAFPELTESEDEKIRKSLIEFLTDIKEISESGRSVWAVRKEDVEMCKSSIAYLEKQKEQKSVSAEELLVKAGLKHYKDGNMWCIFAGDNIQEGICGFGNTIDEAFYQFLMEVFEIQKKPKVDIDKLRRDLYQSGYNDGYQHGKEDAQKEQKPDWSEKDEKIIKTILGVLERDGQVTIYEQRGGTMSGSVSYSNKYEEEIAWLKDISLNHKKFIEAVDKLWSNEWNEEDEKTINDACCFLGEYAGYIGSKNWGKSSMLFSIVDKLKSLYPIKQEWNEEDEEIWFALVTFFKGYLQRYPPLCKDEKAQANRILKWLNTTIKSFRLHHRWKPSKEKMDALKNVAYGTYQNGDGPALRELYEQLLKLGVKEEPEYYQHFDPDC